jgi:mannose/fructose/N-acetylgalactosamine-specific phosphotransferase system component IID
MRTNQLTQEEEMFEATLNLLIQGLLTQLPASLITAAITALCAWAARRKRKPES